MNIYVGNIPYSISEQTLEDLFKEFGTVNAVRIIKDKFTGKSKGFAFVEMSTDDAANTAIENLNGKEVDGRSLRINKALPPQKNEQRRPRNDNNRDRFDRDRRY